MKTAALSKRQEEMLTILTQRYSEYGAPDPTYFDTYKGNLKRTVRALERAGLVTCWEDAEDQTRLWSAINPPKHPED